MEGSEQRTGSMKQEACFTIRKADIGDYEAISGLEQLEYEVHRQARPDYFKSLKESYPESELEELLRLPCPIAWLALQDEEIIGLCFGKIEMTIENSVCKPRKIAFIQDLATLPEYRGRGIATALVRKAREQAIQEKAACLEFCVWNFNENAIWLYEKLGMRVQYYRMEENLQSGN